MDALGPKEIKSAPQWTRTYLSGVAAVHAAATGGNLLTQPASELAVKEAATGFTFPAETSLEMADVLASPLSGESYAAYLQRVRAFADKSFTSIVFSRVTLTLLHYMCVAR
jgi:hypothetical protein